MVSANRTYLGSFNCQEAQPKTGQHLSSFWTLHLCSDMLVIARRTAKSGLVQLMSGTKKEDRRKWAYEFFRLVRLDDLQVVTYSAAGNDQVVTLEWPRARAEGPAGATAAPAVGSAGAAEVESITVTTIENDRDHSSASDASFAMVTMAAAAMASESGSVQDHDNMASFAAKISRAISDCSEKSRPLQGTHARTTMRRPQSSSWHSTANRVDWWGTFARTTAQQVQAPKHVVKVALAESSFLSVESIYVVRPTAGWRSQSAQGNFVRASVVAAARAISAPS